MGLVYVVLTLLLVLGAMCGKPVGHGETED